MPRRDGDPMVTGGNPLRESRLGFHTATPGTGIR
jgi:hypothetical protein